jgi:hypothetical protein
MGRRIGLSVATVAFLVFAAWQLTNYLFLMNVEIYTHHVISFVVETCLAIAAILWATEWSNRAGDGPRRAERLAAVVAASMAAEAGTSSPVSGLLTTLEDIRGRIGDRPEVQELVDRAERYALRIRTTNRGLEEILVPMIER